MKRTLVLMAAVGLFSAIPATPDKGPIMVCHAVQGTSNNFNIIGVTAKELPYHIPGHPFDTYLSPTGGCAVYGG